MGEASSEERILAGFSHLMIIFGWVGTAIALVIWIVRKDKSDFLKKSVKQAVAYQVLALMILKAISLIFGPRISMLLQIQSFSFAPQAIGMVWAVLTLGLLFYGVMGAVASFKGKHFKYAVIGEYVDSILN